jgi:uncharacterized protein YjhX (UPF0386 family)
MAKNIDGIIEAVRYKNGHLLSVRAYERRGATYSDCVVLDRKTLLERLQKGQQYMTGSREEFRASTFKVGRAVRLVKQEGREIIATRENADNDVIEDALLF